MHACSTKLSQANWCIIIYCQRLVAWVPYSWSKSSQSSRIVSVHFQLLMVHISNQILPGSLVCCQWLVDALSWPKSSQSNQYTDGSYPISTKLRLTGIASYIPSLVDIIPMHACSTKLSQAHWCIYILSTVGGCLILGQNPANLARLYQYTDGSYPISTKLRLTGTATYLHWLIISLHACMFNQTLPGQLVYNYILSTVGGCLILGQNPANLAGLYRYTFNC